MKRINKKADSTFTNMIKIIMGLVFDAVASFLFYYYVLGPYVLYLRWDKNIQLILTAIFAVVIFFLWLSLCKPEFSDKAYESLSGEKKGTAVDYELINKDKVENLTSQLPTLERNIKSYIDKRDIQSAMAAYWNLEEMVLQLPSRQKEKFSKRLNKIKSKIDKLRGKNDTSD